MTPATPSGSTAAPASTQTGVKLGLVVTVKAPVYLLDLTAFVIYTIASRKKLGELGMIDYAPHWSCDWEESYTYLGVYYINDPSAPDINVVDLYYTSEFWSDYTDMYIAKYGEHTTDWAALEEFDKLWEGAYKVAVARRHATNEAPKAACPECKGTGQYIGLNTVEPCSLCK